MAGNRNSGRKPSPTSLKLLRGVTRRDRLNLHEPKPEGVVVRPVTLSPGAVAVWDRVAPVCLQMGTLTAGDVEAFAQFCELRAVLEWCAAQKSVDGFSLLVDGKEHRAIKLERETATMIRPYFEYFGLTPSARAKLSRPAEDKPASKWAAVGL